MTYLEAEAIQNKRSKDPNIEIGRDPSYGKYIKLDDVLIAIDHWNPLADLIYVSHAHMDHIPALPADFSDNFSKIKNPPLFICTKITKEIAEARTYGKFTFSEDLWILGKNFPDEESIEYKGVRINLIENGHTYGSVSMFLEGSEKILYTSDFIMEDRHFPDGDVIGGLRPVKCDRLIMECTFGIPYYQFPSFRELLKELTNYIELNLMKDIPIILLAYGFGKSQHILKCLKDSYNIILERTIAQNVRILEQNEVGFPLWQPYGKYKKKKMVDLSNYVLIIPPYLMFKTPYRALIESGANIIALSGKIMNPSFREEFPVNKYLPFSDHCDYDGYISLIEKCSPSKVYLEHGRVEESSYLFHKRFKSTLIYLS